jgi:hypothetical protein
MQPAPPTTRLFKKDVKTQFYRRFGIVAANEGDSKATITEIRKQWTTTVK